MLKHAKCLRRTRFIGRRTFCFVKWKKNKCKFSVTEVKQWKSSVNSKYCLEFWSSLHFWWCQNWFIYLLLNWGTINQLSALEQVRGVQTSTMKVFTKISSVLDLKKLSILAKRSILNVWLGPECSSSDVISAYSSKHP